MNTQADAAKALTAFDYENITVSSSVVGLSAAKIQPASGKAALAAYISIDSAYIRWRSDGGDPAAGSSGHVAYDGSVAPYMSIWLTGTENLKNFRAIRDTGTDAMLRVTYYR
jgi:hypothetical protein